MSKTLMEHVNELNQLMYEANELEDMGQEIPENLMDQINEALTNKSEKIDRCIAWINRTLADNDWLKGEKATLDAQIKRNERSIKRMKDLAGLMMKATGEDRLEGLKGHYFRFQNSKGVIIEDENLIPKGYVVKKVSFSFDKKTIKAELDAGREVPGARIEDRKSVVAK